MSFEAISIRPANSSDLPALCDLLGELFSIESDFNVNRAQQQRGLELLLARAEEACIWVAEHDGAVIGMCTAQILISTAEGGPVAQVEDVVVDGKMRCRGVGTRLLQSVEAWARARGLSRLQLLADSNNHPALRFYAGQGWHTTQLAAWRKAPHISKS